MTLALPSKSFLQRMIAVWLALTVLFTLNQTGGTEALGGFPRLMFWGLQIGAGLATAGVMAELLSLRFTNLRPWLFVLYSGLAGVVLFAPVAYGIDAVFGLSALEEPDSLLDHLATFGPVAAMVAEGLQVLPEYLTCWFLVNLEAFYRVKPHSTSAVRFPAESRDSAVDEPNPDLSRFLRRLPPAIGQDLVAASSDLHYLHVITTQGTAMILGTLTELEQGWGEEGIRIHRSHWVAIKHVKRIQRSGTQWRLETDSGQTFPISRRKREQVEHILGRDFTVTASTVTQTQVSGGKKD